MKEEKIKQIIYGTLVIIWMVTIFCFSNQQSDNSSNTSKGFIKTGLSQVKNFKELEESKQDEIVEQMQHPIRKLAHFTIYAIGGLIIFSFVNTFNICTRKKIILAILIGMLYATTDEIHQLFVDGRSGQITDVLIDTAGVATGSIAKHLFHN